MEGCGNRVLGRNLFKKLQFCLWHHNICYLY
jgi:hypothetical protein